MDTNEVNSTWTFQENKLFESALADIPECVDRWWQKLADAVPGKRADQVRVHYEALIHDLHAIESDHVSISYPDEEDDNESVMILDTESTPSQVSFGKTNGSKHGERERKKGTPWTAEEHRKFLEGLKIYGKGDWRSISRNCVITRTSTQVASHAQRYFLRQESPKKQKKRASIHDTTMAQLPLQMPQLPPQMPPPLPTPYFGQGGGRAPPQMGYPYQQNIGYPT
ncbi:transcription factor DIVARICATA-like [Rutidosis leptorrhynchoides]|uniref:transcription factor DIVARICATA-like n=1 Tax=Rutidosis leptorrhynchoides TaxID=125765 RepID=UPI003A9A505F